ncbi:alcohol dehydrogenase catalytic domain-containing protein [Actinocorallia sp. A-T 12471]|uniref:alcohol dehydrogenase catalytic domain-containing protein n=1 Tax=Actinocorallia sp. A-T 12471 TaxID=3089813 RepID=UPI0029CC30A3|nr:alcohol dehydrogenase catalytic domain-containing protein [Actinocorallia sp. A-T 12471]MDX6741565.1 alcohol dehydrogenase catalytic domain-containing protein [Actinocorallia sp. A-T 12471]
MSTMLAARARQDSPDLALEKIDIPQPGPHDVLVKVAAAGLAPGMMELLKRGAFRHLPTTLGHEAAGHVVAVGEQVTRIGLGDRVRVHPNLSCGSCGYCRSDREQMCPDAAMIGHAAFGAGPAPLYAEYHDGGLAEYIRVPWWLVDRLPDAIGFDLAAKVHDLANAVRALRGAAVPLGGTLLVTAATGTMGTATVKLAPLFGVGRLILVGRSAERLAAVRELAGALPVETVATEELADDWETTGGLTRALRAIVPEGVDALTDYTPAGAGTAQALASLAMGGTMLHMGGNLAPLPLPMVAMMANMWRIVGNRSCTRTDATDVIGLLTDGTLNVDELLTHRFALADVKDAVRAMRARSEPMWMAVVNP